MAGASAARAYRPVAGEGASRKGFAEGEVDNTPSKNAFLRNGCLPSPRDNSATPSVFVLSLSQAHENEFQHHPTISEQPLSQPQGVQRKPAGLKGFHIRQQFASCARFRQQAFCMDRAKYRQKHSIFHQNLPNRHAQFVSIAALDPYCLLVAGSLRHENALWAKLALTQVSQI